MRLTFNDVEFDDAQRVMHDAEPVTGEVYDMRPDGSIAAVETYKFGVQNGVSRSYHRNGQPAFEGVYKVGLPQGVHRYWSEEGELQREVEYDKRGMEM